MTNEFKLTRKQQKVVDVVENEDDKKRIIENMRRDWEWENSLEGVDYDLALTAVPEDLRYTIVSAVHKLPREIRGFVFQKVFFTSVEEEGGQCWHKQNACPWVIVLGDKADESVVAHEIAHAHLGHKTNRGGMEVEVSLRQETKACSLTKQWGFSGCGTEVNKDLLEAIERKKSK